MVTLIREKDDAGEEPYMVFRFGQTMNSTRNKDELCGYLKVYKLPCGKELQTGMDQPVIPALKSAKHMAEKNGIKFILIQEIGKHKFPEELWSQEYD